MTRALRALGLLAAVVPAGCSLAPSDEVLKQLMTSDRSWCISVTSVYGTARLSGTGLPNGNVTCTQEGMVVRSGAPTVP